MAMTMHELWLDDMPLREGDPIICPVCGGTQFTAKTTIYGVQLACWNEPTYIGIREAD